MVEGRINAVIRIEVHKIVMKMRLVFSLWKYEGDLMSMDIFMIELLIN